MSQTPHSISKTSFLKFEQCQKAFYLYKNHPYLRDKLSVDKRLTFKRGHDVGYFAQQLFAGGIDVSKQTKSSAQGIELTQSLIASKEPVIYEATFSFEGALIMADILCLIEDKYYAYEVKSSLKISEIYLKDAYLQYYVLKNSLPDFEDLYLVSLNPDYLREEEIEPKKLFRKRSVKLKAEENIPYFEYQLKEAQSVLDKNTIPNLAIGKHCFKPYQCDYFGTCWKDTLTENSVFNLPLIDKGKLFEWYHQGIKTIQQVSDDLIEKDTPLKIKNAILNNVAIVDTAKINAFLSQIKYPVAAMDMEMWSPAIPLLKGTKPFEMLPFLVCFQNESHSEYYLTNLKTDDREEFAKQLIDLSLAYETVLVYDKTMEVIVINTLIRMFPNLQTGLESLKSKLLDVFDVFLNLSYYHPSFKGNFSLKTVSSLLLGEEVNYTQINSGLEAMHYFEQYRQEEDETKKSELRLELLHYCTTDCLATLKLVEFLGSIPN